MEAIPRKPAGGLRCATLYAADEIEEVEFEGDVCRGIRLRPGAEPMVLPLVEQRSSWTEEAVSERGLAAVRRTLHLETSRWQGRALFDERFLLRAAADGFVAVAEAVDGERFLAGRSIRLGGEQPLRLERLVFRTGSRRTDAPSAEIVLVCCDAAPAPLFIPENE